MDYEKKYKEALERAKKFEEKYGGGYAEYIFPELAESEDERIRRKMIEHFKAKTKETWCNMPVKDIIAYLEKQKEQKPKAKAKSPLSPHELYDAKIEGISQGRQDVLDHPEQFGLQKPAEWSEDTIRKAVKEVGLTQHQIDWFKNNVFPPKPEWSDEDEILRVRTINRLETLNFHGISGKEIRESIDWLKSLCPSWKPSEEQMDALEAATVRYQSTGLESLYEDLKKL